MMEKFNRNVQASNVELILETFVKKIFPGSTNIYCSHYRSVIVFTRLLSGQNNYVIMPCENIADVATGCTLDAIELILEAEVDEFTPGIFQITTTELEAIQNDVEVIEV